MSKLPEKIYISDLDWVATEAYNNGQTEYIRADRAQPINAELADTIDRLERAAYTFGTETLEDEQNHEYSNALKFLRASINDLKALQSSEAQIQGVKCQSKS